MGNGLLAPIGPQAPGIKTENGCPVSVDSNRLSVNVSARQAQGLWPSVCRAAGSPTDVELASLSEIVDRVLAILPHDEPCVCAKLRRRGHLDGDVGGRRGGSWREISYPI